MIEKKPLVYSLTTNYVNHQDIKFHIVHFEDVELVKGGFDVKTIAPHSKGTSTNEVMDSVIVKRFRYLPENYQINSIPIAVEISKSKFGLIKVIIMIVNFFISTFFECLKQKPDIILGHWVFPSGVIAYVMSRIFRTKFVGAIHGGEVGLLQKFRFLRQIVVYSLNHSSLVIANSTFTKNEFIKMGVKENKFVRITGPPNFVEHTSDVKFLEEFRKKFTLPSCKIILFTGRLVELKGTEYLIRSLLEIKNIDVHLIIAGNGILMDSLKNLTVSLGLEHKVTFFGRADRKQLGLLHDISDIFVCPSIIDSHGSTEGMGLVVPEAMESGLPVIASSVGGLPEMIKHEINGLLVPQKNSTAIAKAIERILLDEEFRKKVIENSKETVKEFSPETTGTKYVKSLKNVLEN